MRVPVQQDISDEVFINRLQQLYTPAEVAAVQKEMEDVVDAALVRQRYTARMNDISALYENTRSNAFPSGITAIMSVSERYGKTALKVY